MAYFKFDSLPNPYLLIGSPNVPSLSIEHIIYCNLELLTLQLKFRAHLVIINVRDVRKKVEGRVST